MPSSRLVAVPVRCQKSRAASSHRLETAPAGIRRDRNASAHLSFEEEKKIKTAAHLSSDAIDHLHFGGSDDAR